MGGKESNKPTDKPKAQEPPVPKTTSLFRALNFELYAKPNVVTMGVGVAAVLFCVGYITYMNSKSANSDTYSTLNPDGSITKRPKVSKWDT